MLKTVLFARLTKIDEAQRLVYGIATGETTDKANEKFDYAKSKPYFEAWSSGLSKATGGLNLGNIREMHGKSAAGQLKEITFDDVAKNIPVCAYISDDQAWQKCLKRTYTGFSIGGEYVGKYDDPDEPGVTKYVARPSEISLVDNPCYAGAHFTMVKADGATAELGFDLWEPTNDEIAAKAQKLFKMAEANYAAKPEGAAPNLADYMDKAVEALKRQRGFEVDDEQDADAQLSDVEGGDADRDLDDAEGDDDVDFSSDAQGHMGGGHHKWLEPRMEKLSPLTLETAAEVIKDAKTPKAAKAALKAHFAKDSGQEPGDMATQQAKEKVEASTDGGAAQGGGNAKGKKTGVNDPNKPTSEKADWGLEQVWLVKADGKTFATKAEASTHVDALKSVAEREDPIGKAVRDALAAVKAAPTPEDVPELDAVQKALQGAVDAAAAVEVYRANHTEGLTKGMYQVSRFADALQQLASLQVDASFEAAREGDGSSVPESLRAAIVALADTYTAMAQEELAEMISAMKEELPSLGDDVGPYGYYECAVRGFDLVKADTALLVKVGARNSAKDAKSIQAVHDHAQSLGAKCDAGNVDKAVPEGELEKRLAEQREELEKKALDGIATLTKAMGDMAEEIKALKAAPMDMPTFRVVEKTDETGGGARQPVQDRDPSDVLVELITKIGPEGIQQALMKAALNRPMTLVDQAS